MSGVPNDMALSREFIAQIPADAAYVQAGLYDFGWLDALQDLSGDDGLDEIFDVDCDVFLSLLITYHQHSQVG